MSYSPSVKELEPAQARAAAYALIAHGFQYPDEETLSALSEPMRWEHWPGVLERTGRVFGAPSLTHRNFMEWAREPALLFGSPLVA